MQPTTAQPSSSAASYLQVAPLLLVLLAFFGIPLLMIVAVSFFEFDGISSVPAFQFSNYTDLFTSANTLTLYLKTVEYALIVWAITLVVGFTVSYFLAGFCDFFNFCLKCGKKTTTPPRSGEQRTVAEHAPFRDRACVRIGRAVELTASCGLRRFLHCKLAKANAIDLVGA